MEKDGALCPASIVWKILTGRLYRCSPEQVRRCSLREVAEKEANTSRSWTFEDELRNIDPLDRTDLVDKEYPPEDDQELEDPLDVSDEAEEEETIPVSEPDKGTKEGESTSKRSLEESE